MKFTINIFLSFFITIQIFYFSITYASIQKLDQQYYSPTDYGLKDLVFEIRIPGLKDILKEKLRLTDLEDFYFRVYWMHPNTYRIEVNGFPKGFIQLKKTLMQQIHLQMDYVIPKKFREKLKGYELKTTKKNNMTMIMASDKTGMEDINEMKLFLDKNGKLTQTVTFSLLGTQTSNYKIFSTKWSHGKFLISEVITTNKKGMFTTTTKTRIDHGKFKNFGLPKRLSSITKLQTMGKNKKMRTLRRKTTQMNFRNYIINQGIAKKYITDSNKKK